MRTLTPWATLALLCLAVPATSSLFADNFDVDNTANWVVNRSTATPAGSSADFFFDYSSVGVPSAPRSGGTTRGLRMDANVGIGVFSGLSVSPIGQSFSGDYTLRADVWWNFIGPAPAGGSGSTQAGGLGIGTAGTKAQWAGGGTNTDSVWFACTTDGNSSADWRAYSSAANTSYGDGSTVYFASGAGNRNNTHPYYAGFGGVTPPAAQTALFPTQTGTTLVGSVGFAWHDVVVEKRGNLITWTVDGLPIAQVDATTVTLGGGNIHLNYFDTNASSSTDTTGMNFILFDNVEVVPEPATLATLGLGALALLRRRRR